MTAYVYVLWAIEDELVKIGKTIRFSKRASEHNGNSSNPLSFREWQLYRFDTQSDAGKIEALAMKLLAAKGFSYRRKKELFKCSPTQATDAIEEVLRETKTSCLKNFPFDLATAFEKFANFPSLPEYALEICTPQQREIYWKGVTDTLNCLRYFEGIEIKRSDILGLMGYLNARGDSDRELWPAILDHYRNNTSHSFDKQEAHQIEGIASKAREFLINDRRNAFADWQEIED